MDVPVLQIRHSAERDWYVAATWPDGTFEEIGSFNDENEASEWIAKGLQDWLDDRAGTSNKAKT
jgi:hypothetical protein